MSLRYGLFALVAFLALGASALSVGTASADRAELQPSAYVTIDDGGGGDPRGPDGFVSVDDGGTKQICETGPSSTTCVGKGWIMAGVCKVFGGDIVAGDPGGVFVCEFNRE